ncbi:hypothetical protein [Roseisolibacter agri]|uniref:Uncharacterized protein n=1 Tax=Roseisolibacter agri TaxID=2014610 RepID=A0AA37QEC5_9BACT|nr:hypothetical protein [Roseisolibacter agri]GLC24188.1 hypothetical protein rosag_07010 [Roseisolibacter agri]
MDAVRLSRVTTALVVAGVGGVAGHVLWPFAPGAGLVRPAAFVAVMLATGALRGWREAVVREASAVGRAAMLYAAGALAVALLGYAIMHGRPG